MSERRDRHEHWMRLALDESYKALPACIPNPPVGCVIVRDGALVSSGFTNAPGQPHAEAMALRNLPVSAHGLSVYVTLEPCSFAGRTPSCAAALIAAGVAGVYVGIVDPDPRNQGRGIDMLRDAGIPVTVGILGEDVENFLGPYLIRA